jgi:putative membrane protein
MFRHLMARCAPDERSGREPLRSVSLWADRLASPAKGNIKLKSIVIGALLGTLMFATAAVAADQAAKPTDPQIAHIAYTAGQLDIEAAKQALDKSKNKDVRAFAQQMVGDHTTVNNQALALVKKLKVTPEDNPTSQSLTKQADSTRKQLASLNGAAFDKAYVDNEVAYHKTVNAALSDTLIPDAQNAELKALLQSGLALFQAHQKHAEQLAGQLQSSSASQ